MKKGPIPETIDEYIASFPRDVQAILQKVRATIRAAAPGATEKISYQIPTFTLHGNLVHFAAWKEHIGFYPASSGVREFKKELGSYVQAKGSVQFPLDKPIPYELIAKIVRFRAQENATLGVAKAKTKFKSTAKSKTKTKTKMKSKTKAKRKAARR
jgi:uncharacterized protein YdhG (YjbR/CyaY superfamily)